MTTSEPIRNYVLYIHDSMSLALRDDILLPIYSVVEKHIYDSVYFLLCNPGNMIVRNAVANYFEDYEIP